MLTDFIQAKPKKIKLDIKRCGRPLMNIKLPTIAYLPPLEKACYINQVPIRNYQKYESSAEFKIQLNCYLSRHPHLTFKMFHRYDIAPTQIIFYDNTKKCNVAILLKDFREYEPNNTGGYKSVAISLDDVHEKR
jgi:hypothetical protein